MCIYAHIYVYHVVYYILYKYVCIYIIIYILYAYVYDIQNEYENNKILTINSVGIHQLEWTLTIAFKDYGGSLQTNCYSFK